MPARRNKRNDAYALSRQLRRRLYNGVAVATLAYVVLSLIRFHGQFPYLSYELAIIWAIFLLCYATIKEVLRWSGEHEEETYHSELWAIIVLAGAAWMIGWNILRTWFLHLPSIPFPEDYEAAVIETMVLYTLSIISSSLYNKGAARRPRHHLARHGKSIGSEIKTVAAEVENGIRNEVKAVTAAENTLANRETAGRPDDVRVMLTKAPAESAEVRKPGSAKAEQYGDEGAQKS
ncbi:MAG TPA: hypothetical protein VNG29_00415 [Candidatus Paceibacterota bacterium]|nr:hypothetical protein [Candidatus Paceibacterota bacterium]